MTAEQKAPFEKKAEVAKADYEKAMGDFKEQGGVPQKRRSAKDKEEKPAKDPEAPKRPAGGAYGVFLAEKRDEIKKGLPADHKITDVAKAAGEAWKKLSEAQRKPFEEQYAAKSEAYKKEMEAYKQKKGEAAEAEPAEEAPKKKASPKKRAAPEKAEKEAPAAKRGKTAGKGKAEAPAVPAAVLSEAKKLGYETALLNLAGREDVSKAGKAPKDMLEALKGAGGLVTKAKRALLGA